MRRLLSLRFKKVDICIVLDQIDHMMDRRIREVVWEIGFENDRVITTVLITKSSSNLVTCPKARL